MKHTAIAMTGLALVCLSVSGCSHTAEPASPSPAPAPVGGGTTLPDTAFLSILRSVSPAQRPAYVQQHPDQVSQIMHGPNQTDKTEYTLLMQAR